MTNLQSSLATQLSATLDQLREADPPDKERISALLVRINEAADHGEITVKEWRELVVMASRVRRTARKPDPSRR